MEPTGFDRRGVDHAGVSSRLVSPSDPSAYACDAFRRPVGGAAIIGDTSRKGNLGIGEQWSKMRSSAFCSKSRVQ
jgi:hypothetical protein